MFEVLDPLLSFQFFSYLWRNISRINYSYPDYGMDSLAKAQADVVLPHLEKRAKEGVRSGQLRLDPSLKFPAYYELSDFHQHPGGVWCDPMAGVVYEHGRASIDRTGGDDFYRMIFSYLPKGRKYPRVLDTKTSLTHLPDLLSCLNTLISKRITGTFNVVNPGSISPYEVMELYTKIVDPSHRYERLTLDHLSDVVKAGRSNCLLSTAKLAALGIALPDVKEAMQTALIGLASVR